MAMIDGKRVWIAGHRGLVGGALVKRFAREDCSLLTASRAKLDLRDQAAVNQWMDRYRPEIIVKRACLPSCPQYCRATPTE